MAIFYKDVEIETEVDVEVSVKEFYETMDEDEEKEMLQLIKSGEYALGKEYYLSNIVYGMPDYELLNSTEFLSKLAYFLKYEDSTLLEFLKEELK